MYTGFWHCINQSAPTFNAFSFFMFHRVARDQLHSAVIWKRRWSPSTRSFALVFNATTPTRFIALPKTSLFMKMAKAVDERWRCFDHISQFLGRTPIIAQQTSGWTMRHQYVTFLNIAESGLACGCTNSRVSCPGSFQSIPFWGALFIRVGSPHPRDP